MLCPVAGANDPVYPLANCIPYAFRCPSQMPRGDFVFDRWMFDFGHVASAPDPSHASTGPTGESLDALPELEVLVADVGVELVGELGGKPSDLRSAR